MVADHDGCPPAVMKEEELELVALWRKVKILVNCTTEKWFLCMRNTPDCRGGLRRTRYRNKSSHSLSLRCSQGVPTR